MSTTIMVMVIHPMHFTVSIVHFITTVRMFIQLPIISIRRQDFILVFTLDTVITDTRITAVFIIHMVRFSDSVFTDHFSMEDLHTTVGALFTADQV